MVSIGPLEIDFRFGRRRRSPLIYLIALVLLCGAWLLRSDPSWVRALEEAVAEPAATSFQLSEHTDFEWVLVGGVRQPRPTMPRPRTSS